QSALAFFDLESNGRPLDGNNFANQLHEVCDRTALFSGINAEERFFLFLRSPLIDVDDSAPITLKYVSGNVYDKCHREARHIDAVDFSFLVMMCQCGIASPPIRVHADPTRAKHLAVADFQKTSFEFVSHSSSPFRKISLTSSLIHVNSFYSIGCGELTHRD